MSSQPRNWPLSGMSCIFLKFLLLSKFSAQIVSFKQGVHVIRDDRELAEGSIISSHSDFSQQNGCTAEQKCELANTHNRTIHISGDFTIADDSIQMLDPVRSRLYFLYMRM
jgi:hypothetical protein